ncbi:MAG: methionyl-tRNA formyltransferase [Desulfuromonadia bacterium]
MRIVFMGTPEFAVPTLDALAGGEDEIVLVVTQPDRPKGRGQALQPPPVKRRAMERGIPVMQPLKVREPETLAAIQGYHPDLIVVVAFGQILPKPLLEMPTHGCINVHASILPRYRGAAPINWCIIEGEKETGITTMQMDVGLDTGDMLLKRSIPIGPEETAGELHDRLMTLGAETMVETLALLKRGELSPVKQDDALATYAPMLKKETGLVDWTKPAQAIVNLVRGVDPWPGAYCWLEGMMLKIFSPRPGERRGEPGTVLSATAAGIEIACGDGSVIFREVQAEGRRRMDAASFCAGHRIPPGARIVRERTGA